jgi:hypothetical protein
MAFEIDAGFFASKIEVLQSVATMDGKLGERLREYIAAELKTARDQIVSDIKFANGDPRGTAHAVKRYVARKYIGGVLSILNGKRSGGVSGYEAPRKVYPGPGGQRGGNRMLRSQRTQDIMSYAGVDRGLVLRFVNSGTKPRYSNGRNDRKSFAQLQNEGTYYRGSIAPRNFFDAAGAREMQSAVKRLEKVIDEEFERLFKN